MNLNNYNLIKSQLKSAKLLIVSKTRSIDEIDTYYQLGNRDFGENKAQELLEKINFKNDIRWHFIGHLQTNKVKQILPYTYLIHSVDSIKLLQTINKEAIKINKIQNILIELALTNDDNKTGIKENEMENFLISAIKLPNIKVMGIMAMGPLTKDKVLINNTFAKAFQVYNKYQKAYNLTELSMGMSQDYEIALDNHATIIRIGSKLFN